MWRGVERGGCRVWREGKERGSTAGKQLPFFDPGVFLYRFGRDSRGRLRFRGVVGLHVGGGGGDSTPSLAGLITDRYRCQDKAKQADCR